LAAGTDRNIPAAALWRLLPEAMTGLPHTSLSVVLDHLRQGSAVWFRRVKQSGDEITVPPAVGPLDKEEPVKAKVSAQAAAIDLLRRVRKLLSTSEIVERVVKTLGL